MTLSTLQYADQGPVLEAYHKSRKFVQIIMGPLGSAKTTTSIFKLLESICEQKPNKQGERRSRWTVIRNCFDDQTEILTELRGWQLFRDLLPEDKVAMLDGDEMKFVTPSYYYQAPYKGEMIGFENEGVDFLVTPEHKLWVSKAQTRKKVWSQYDLMLASDAYGQNELRVRRDAEWKGADPGYSTAVFEWLGFWFAEGTIGEYAGGRRFSITQVKDDGIEYARQVFTAAGIKFGEQKRDKGLNFAVSLSEQNPLGLELWERLQNCGKATSKAVPAWVKAAPPEHLQAFLRGFVAGDGHVRANGVTTAYTSSRQLADDLQEIALKAGVVTNLSSRDRIGQLTVVDGVLTAPTAIEHTITFVGPAKNRPRLTAQGSRKRGWYKQDYDGVVYCVEVPTHVVLVRRGGKAHWSSQTYPDLTNTTIRDFRSIIDPLRLGTFTMGHPPEMRMDFDLPDRTRVQAEIIFIALDKDDDVRKLRGLNITGAWVNELKEIPKSIIDMLMGRVDRYPTQGTSTWAGIFGDTNAWDSDHWLEVVAEGKRHGQFADYDVFIQPGAVLKIDGEWAVNPLRENRLFLNEEYYRRQIEGKREDWIKVNLANQVGYYVDGRAVHPEYSDSLHAAPRELVPSPGVVQVGLDFGLTPAAAFLQRQASGQWWWFDEVVIEDGDAITLADTIRAKCAEWQARLGANRDGQPPLAFVFRGDPSGDNRAQSDSGTPFKVMRANGVLAYPASSNDPVIRRAALDRVLTRTVKGKPGFQISPTCRWARKGLAGGFHYKRVAVSGQEGKFRDEPNKNMFSHVCEAGEYSLMDAGENAVINAAASSAPRLQRPISTGSAWNPFEM